MNAIRYFGSYFCHDQNDCQIQQNAPNIERLAGAAENRIDHEVILRVNCHGSVNAVLRWRDVRLDWSACERAE